MAEQERRNIFDKIERLVATKFYDPNFKGRDWHAIVERHRTKILSAADWQQFESAVNEMLRELGSGGLGLLSASSKITPKNSINATFRTVETEYGQRWVFQDVHAGGPAAAAGIVSGDVLIFDDGHDVIPPEKPSFSMGRNHELVIERVGGRSKVVISVPDPKHKENPCAVPNTVMADVSDGVAIVKIPLFPGKLGMDFARDVTTAFKKRVNGVDRLVLDLRGNPGGGAGCLRLMSLLTPGKKPVGFWIGRTTAVHGYDKSKFPRFDRIPRFRVEIPLLALRFARKKSILLVTEGLGRRAFHGRVVVLVNEHSTCASEMVAVFAREEAGATIVGMATPGRLVSHTGFDVGHGFTLALPVGVYESWAGTRADETGIAPDVSVDWSYSNTRNGTDTQLVTAVAVLKTL